MSAVEPHPRRRALRRAFASSVLAGFLLLGGPAAAQTEPTLLPRPEEPETTTTTTEVEAPTTTEDEPEPTRTEQQTATTRAPTTTEGSFDVGDGPDDVIDDQVIDDVVIDEDVIDEDSPVEEVPEETTSTGRDLLVSGDGTDGAESTTTTSTTLVEVAGDDEAALDEEAQIWLVVAGLVVVAALIGVWTWRYWVRTRPVAVEEEADPTTVFPAGAARR